MDYDVKVINAISSFVLTLSETFDPLWHLAGSLPFDSSRVDHEMVDGFANGWMINILGNFSFSIVYGPGRSVIWSYIGSLLSGLTLTTGVIVATALSRAK